MAVITVVTVVVTYSQCVEDVMAMSCIFTFISAADHQTAVKCQPAWHDADHTLDFQSGGSH